MNIENLKKLEEYVWRWKNHYKMFSEIEESTMSKEKLQIWKSQVDNCFREKIKSKL